jgi:membrane-associated phospholipid phosphatase
VLRNATLVLLCLLFAAPLSAEDNPMKWASHRKAADWISTGLVATNIGGELVASFRTNDRKHALGCMALRNGIGLGVSEALKYTIRRDRPDHSDRLSFPSQHAMFAGINTGWNFSVSIPIAIGAGYGRAAADKHHASDIVAGAAIAAAARLVCSSTQ